MTTAPTLQKRGPQVFKNTPVHCPSTHKFQSQDLNAGPQIQSTAKLYPVPKEGLGGRGSEDCPAPQNKCFSNFNVHVNHQGFQLKYIKMEILILLIWGGAHDSASLTSP